jgi:hypothetical protein
MMKVMFFVLVGIILFGCEDNSEEIQGKAITKLVIDGFNLGQHKNISNICNQIPYHSNTEIAGYELDCNNKGVNYWALYDDYGFLFRLYANVKNSNNSQQELKAEFVRVYGEPKIEKAYKNGNSSYELICWGDCLVVNTKISPGKGDSIIAQLDSNNHYQLRLLGKTYNDQVKINNLKARLRSQKYVGDSVDVHIAANKLCSAVIIELGNEKSKVEYTEWCETSLITHVSKKQKEWIENNRILKKN